MDQARIDNRLLLERDSGMAGNGVLSSFQAEVCMSFHPATQRLATRGEKAVTYPALPCVILLIGAC